MLIAQLTPTSILLMCIAAKNTKKHLCNLVTNRHSWLHINKLKKNCLHMHWVTANKNMSLNCEISVNRFSGVLLLSLVCVFAFFFFKDFPFGIYCNKEYTLLAQVHSLWHISTHTHTLDACYCNWVCKSSTGICFFAVSVRSDLSISSGVQQNAVHFDVNYSKMLFE